MWEESKKSKLHSWRNYKHIEPRGYLLLPFGQEYSVVQFSITKYKNKMHRTVTFSVILYGCEIWSIRLREKHRLKVSENRVLTGYLGQTGGSDWKSVLLSGLLIKYYSGDWNKIMRWAGPVACMGERRYAYRILMCKLRERYRLEDLGLGGGIILKLILEK